MLKGWVKVILPNERVFDFKPQYPKLKPAIREWLEEHVGEKISYPNGYEPHGDWHHTIPITDPKSVFYFRRADIALLFKLTWG